MDDKPGACGAARRHQPGAGCGCGGARAEAMKDSTLTAMLEACLSRWGWSLTAALSGRGMADSCGGAAGYTRYVEGGKADGDGRERAMLKRWGGRQQARRVRQNCWQPPRQDAGRAGCRSRGYPSRDCGGVCGVDPRRHRGGSSRTPVRRGDQWDHDDSFGVIGRRREARRNGACRSISVAQGGGIFKLEAAPGIFGECLEHGAGLVVR